MAKVADALGCQPSPSREIAGASPASPTHNFYDVRQSLICLGVETLAAGKAEQKRGKHDSYADPPLLYQPERLLRLYRYDWSFRGYPLRNSVISGT